MPTPSPNDLTRHQLDELDQLLQRMLKLPLATPNDELLTKPPSLPQPDLPPGWRLDVPATTRVPLVSEPTAGPSPMTVVMRSAEEPASTHLGRPDVPSWGPDPLTRYQATETQTAPKVEPQARYQATETQTAPKAEPPRLFGPPASDFEIAPSTGTNLPGAVPQTGTLRGVDAPATPAGFKSQLHELAAPVLLPEIEAVVKTPTPDVQEPTSTSPTGSSIIVMPLVGLNTLLEGMLKLFGPLGTFLLSTTGKNLLALLGFILLIGAALWSGQGLGYWKLPIPR